MYCDQCGAALPANVRFCSACGKSATTVRTISTGNRLARHLRLLAILWFASGALSLVGAAGFWLAGSFILPRIVGGGGIPGFIPGMLQGLVIFAFVKAGACIVAGWGLLQREPWARMLALVLAFLSLLNLPFGTALGIYTLWVLLPFQSGEEYARLSQAA